MVLRPGYADLYVTDIPIEVTFHRLEKRPRHGTYRPRNRISSKLLSTARTVSRRSFRQLTNVPPIDKSISARLFVLTAREHENRFPFLGPIVSKIVNLV